MCLFRQPVALTVLLVPVALGCGSEDIHGKIEGKWKVVSADGKPLPKDLMSGTDIDLFLDFRPDGTLVRGVSTANPSSEAAVKEWMATPAKCKYKILSKDEIEVFEVTPDIGMGKGNPLRLKNQEKVKVAIRGDEMTFTPEESESVKLTRIK
jgi:hypothetical protein